ncbi:DgyrCDS1176 [Dimorphilus gyrociliatus]|uniref:DgyrCDS1176 n=1 Tax=Dimorphilus gyrociliatus TaxID=2664684 RepID=A0A7I8V6H3_9ANNE|nr:DgyrCDS1176 [Dimorphilus gyrociliatus]
MIPQHVVPPQTSPFPMELTLSSYIYNEGTTIDITLKHKNNTPIAGVFAQMRRANSPNTTLYGSFEGDNDNFRTACNESRAITHSKRLISLNEIKFTWKPPQDNADSGPLQLWISIVQDFTTFWVQQKSNVINYSNALPPTQEISLADCSTTKDCFKVPENCGKEADCDYLLTWRPDNQRGLINFEISAKIPTDQFWTAVGFSKDLDMGEDSVIDCLVNASTSLVEVQASWNEGRTNEVLNNKLLGLIPDSISGARVNDRLRCRFQRQITIARSDTNKIYDLNTEYYVFLGKGIVLQDSTKMQHSQIPEKSASKLLMTTIRNGTTRPTSDPSQGIDTRRCGSEKGCYRYPEGCEESVCHYLLTWKPSDNKEKIEFEISADDSDSKTDWTSVAFSEDTIMGDDSVIDCLYNSDDVSINIQASWNRRVKDNEVLNNKLLGLDQDTFFGSRVNGRLRCRFTRSVKVANDDPEASRVFDLSEQYYVFIGKGSAVRGIKMKHTSIPVISPRKVPLTEIGDVSGLAKFPLVKAHGILMIVAWSFFANIGLLLPRYFKLCWNKYQLFNEKIWFQIHRMCMITVVLCTITAFIVIFVEVKGFSQGSKPIIHAIIGIIVTVLCVLNPIMAVFRPPPKHPKRPIFNWLHFLAGQIAHILTVPMIYLAFPFGKVYAPSWLKWVYTAIIIQHIFVEVLLFLYKYVKISPNSVNPLNGKDSDNQVVAEEETKPDNVPTAIIMTYFFILLALVTTIVITLGRA